MPIAAPVIEFVTVTVDTLSVDVTPPIDAFFSHVLVYVYDYPTGVLVHTSPPFAGGFYTTPALQPNAVYLAIAQAVNTLAELSPPSADVVIATTDAHNNVLADPQVVETDHVQESRAKARIEYRLEDTVERLGELVNAEYSFNGVFTDAVQMKESTDLRHEGRFFLQFQVPAFIVDPHHFFIWDLSEIPDNTVHTYKVRLRGKSGAVYSPMLEFDFDIDTTVIEPDIPVPTVITGASLDFTLPLFNGQTPLSGATVTVTEIRNDADVNVLALPVVIPELGITGVYQAAIPLPFPAGRYRVFFTATGLGYSTSGSRVLVIVSTSYNINFALNVATLCCVYGRLVDNMDRPLVGTVINAFYIREPSRYDRIGAQQIQVTTNEFGFFAIHLLRNTQVTLQIPDLDYAERATIPDQYAAQFNTIGFNMPSVLQRDAYGHVLPPEDQA